nr:unnamed protein product [Callosobruchus analis]
MKNNKFSLIADESTDRSNVKNLALVVRINCQNEIIKDYFLALIPVQDATGAALFEHIIDFFNNYKVQYKENCIGFASDGANNMMGQHNSLVSRLKEAIPNIFIMKCICHSFHLSASYACEKLPQEVEQLCRDIYNYFSNSPKRSGELREFQEYVNVSPLKMLHPAATRWLSLEAVINRLKIFLQAPETKLYLEFLLYVLPFFIKLNLLMQSEKPLIHVIYKEVTNIVKTLLECYIEDNVLSNNNVFDIDYMNPHNFLPIESMYFGAYINTSSCSPNILRSIKLKCLEFYIESVKQILTRFPLKNSVLAKLDFIDPKIVINKKIKSIADEANEFPNLLIGIMQEIDNEWRLTRNLNFIDFDLRENDDGKKFLN